MSKCCEERFSSLYMLRKRKRKLFKASFCVSLEVIKVHKTNQVGLMLRYNYMAVHTKIGDSH